MRSTGGAVVVTSTANPAVKQARKLARRPAADDRGLLLVEGPQAVAEGIGHLRRLFVSEAASPRCLQLAHAAAARGTDVVTVTEPVLAAIAGTVTPQGVVGVAALPGPPVDDVLEAADLVVALASVRDPGNAGTIVRTADAAGADAVVVTGDSVDLRNPKAVRASAGSIFHLPLATGGGALDLVQRCRAHGLRPVAADARGDVVYTDVDLTVPTALVFGNEAWGLGEEVLAACDVVARIPLHQRPGGSAESLNLAATVAVCCFEAARQRTAGRP